MRFKTLLYTGTAGTLSVSGAGFQPDLVITKRRSGGVGPWRWTDSTRGVGLSLESSALSVEATEATGLTAFGSDGFTLGADTDYNTSAAPYLALALKKAAGEFDIVTYTGNGVAGRTVAHGLGVTPELIIIKCRSAANNWSVYSAPVGSGSSLALNASSPASVSSTQFNNTAPTSSVFSVGTNVSVNANGATYVAYVFASSGSLKIGSYTGNASTSGPTVSTGFQPKAVIIKRTDSSTGGSWFVFDSARDTTSPHAISSALESTANEATATNGVAFSSSSFQIVDATTANVSGGTYLYVALADGSDGGVIGTATGTLSALTGAASGAFKKKTGGNGGGSTPGNIGAGDKYATKVTMPETGTITTLILESQQTKAVNSRMALYADNSGVPGERIAVTADKSSVVTGDNEYTLPTPIVRNSGAVFWIALHADATINWLLGAQTGGSYTNSDTFSDGISNPFGTGTLLGTKAPLVAIYYEGTPVDVIINGDGSGTLGAITGAASGLHIPAIGTGSGVLSAITGAASGSHIPAIGTGAGALDAITGAANGTHAATGTGAGALPALFGLGVSGDIFVGLVSGTLPALSGSASGTHLAPALGTGTAALDPLTGAATGSAGVVARRRFLSSGDPRKQPDALKSISWLEQQAEAQKRLRDLFGVDQGKPELVTGSSVAILQDLTGQGFGAVGRTGQAAVMLSPFGGSASADHWDSVSSDNELLLLVS